MAKAKKKVLIVTGDGGEALEIMYPYQRLKEEGYEVHIAAPSKKKIHSVVHDMEEGWDTYTEKLGYKVQADLAFKDVKPQEYDALVIPGGRAPEYIRGDKHLKKIVSYFADSKKPIAFECHAGLILAPLGVLEGRKCAAYPPIAADIEAAGGKFIDKEVVVDGTWVSARAWPDHPAFMREFMKVLKEETA